MTGNWPSPFLVLVALIAVPYLARSTRRAFGRDPRPSSGATSEAESEQLTRIRRLERYRSYCIVGVFVPLIPLYIIRPPVAPWLVIGLVALLLASLVAVAVTSFLIGWVKS